MVFDSNGFNIKGETVKDAALCQSNSYKIFSSYFSLKDNGFTSDSTDSFTFYTGNLADPGGEFNHAWATDLLDTYYLHNGARLPLVDRRSTPIPSKSTFPLIDDEFDRFDGIIDFGKQDSDPNTGGARTTYIKELIMTVNPDSSTWAGRKTSYNYTDNTGTTTTGTFIASHIMLELQAQGGTGGGSYYTGNNDGIKSGGGGGSGAWARVAISLKKIDTIRVTYNRGWLQLYATPRGESEGTHVCDIAAGGNGGTETYNYHEAGAGGEVTLKNSVDGVYIMTTANGVAGGRGRIGAPGTTEFAKAGSTHYLAQSNNKLGGAIVASSDTEHFSAGEIDELLSGGSGGASIYGCSAPYSAALLEEGISYYHPNWGVGGMGNIKPYSTGSWFNFMAHTIGRPFVRLYYNTKDTTTKYKTCKYCNNEYTEDKLDENGACTTCLSKICKNCNTFSNILDSQGICQTCINNGYYTCEDCGKPLYSYNALQNHTCACECVCGGEHGGDITYYPQYGGCVCDECYRSEDLVCENCGDIDCSGDFKDSNWLCASCFNDSATCESCGTQNEDVCYRDDAYATLCWDCYEWGTIRCPICDTITDDTVYLDRLPDNEAYVCSDCYDKGADFCTGCDNLDYCNDYGYCDSCVEMDDLGVCRICGEYGPLYYNNDDDGQVCYKRSCWEQM